MKHREVRVGNVYECRAAVISGLVEVIAEIPRDNRNVAGYAVRNVATGKNGVVVARHIHPVKIETQTGTAEADVR